MQSRLILLDVTPVIAIIWLLVKSDININLPEIVFRCQFNQHFTRAFFVKKFIDKAKP